MPNDNSKQMHLQQKWNTIMNSSYALFYSKKSAWSLQINYKTYYNIKHYISYCFMLTYQKVGN